MSIENVKGMIWDLDGTLIDSAKILPVVLRELALVRGLVMPTDEEIRRNFHGTMDQTLEALFDISSKEERDELAAAFYDRQEAHYETPSEHLYEDAIDLARRAAERDIIQLVLTNRGHAGRRSASPHAIVGNTVLANYIHEIRAGDEVVAQKPDVAAVSDWVEKHTLTGEDILVVGDQVPDGQLAINLGARAILIKRGGDIPNMERLSENWQNHIEIVDNLSSVELA